ncbi:MAG: UDP-N-acetylmuramate--L-alanine ligase [Candidatus Andersenbacteria bacterium]
MTVRAKQLKLGNVHWVHCVGIGGIGVSALARLLAASRVYVTGSNLGPSATVDYVKRLGIPVSVGPHRAANLPREADLVVYSNDVPASNPELVAARKRRVRVMSYPEALPLLFAGKRLIGVSGTHGKTTTTGMLGSVLVQAEWDPTIVVGGMLPTLRGNARLGAGRDFVLEADEYKRSFLNYPCDVAVITNVEADHLNYYKDLDDVRSAFREFAALVPRKGLVVACGDDTGTRLVTHDLHCGVLWYGLDKRNELVADHLKLDGPHTTFRVSYHGKPHGSFKLLVPGEHNVYNALAVIGVAAHLGVPLKHVQAALASFPGASRRFEIVGEVRGITVVDDYAHHPTELRATLQAARSRFGKRRIVVIFQPHFYGRLRDFFGEFVEALQLADLVIIPPVFAVAGRENDAAIREKFNSETLAAAVAKKGAHADATTSLDAALTAALGHARRGDVLMTIGAGQVTELAPKLVKGLRS